MSIVMEEVKEELGTIFGYDRGSREVGITGRGINFNINNYSYYAFTVLLRI